jgi:hypothetical protein
MGKFLTVLTLMTLAIAFTSCSSDDKESIELSAKINGVTKKFKNIVVNEVEYVGYSDYVINAVQSDNAAATLQIKLGKEVLGTESIYYIQYYNGENYFSLSSPEINSNITESSGAKIKGNFSAVLLNNNGMGSVNITEGMIDVKH